MTEPTQTITKPILTRRFNHRFKRRLHVHWTLLDAEMHEIANGQTWTKRGAWNASIAAIPQPEIPKSLREMAYRYDLSDTPFLDALMRGLPRRPPPSRYTRLRWQLRAAQRRAGDAWRVLWHGLPEHDDY